MGLFGSDGDSAEIKIELTGAEEATKQAEKLGEEIEKLGKKTEESGKKTEGLGVSLGSIAKYGAIATGVLTAISAVTAASIVKLADAGDKLGDVSDAFERMGGSAQTIEEANKAILGVIPNVDLLQLANKALVAGIPEVNTNFASLAEYGKRVGESLGIDAKAGIEQLIGAMVSGRAVALKHLGIIIDSDKAVEDYAKKMNILGRELSDAEKKMAIQIQAQDQINKKLKEMAPSADSVTDAIEGISAELVNFKGKTGQAINENLELTKALRGFQGVIKDIDIEAFAGGVATLTAKFITLATDGISFASTELKNFSTGLSILNKLGTESKFLGFLSTGFERLGTVIGVVAGNITSTAKEVTEALFDIKGATEAVAKEQEEASAQAEDYKNLLGEEKKASETLQKQLKEEADARDRLKQKIEAQKKATEELEKKRQQEIETQKKVLAGMQTELRQSQEQLNIDAIGAQLESAIISGDSGLASQLEDQLRDNVREGIIRGVEDAGGSLQTEGMAETIEGITGLTTAEQIAKIRAEAEKKIFNPADTFLGGLFGADKTPEQLKGMYENMASALESSVASAITLGLEGGFNKEAIAGLAGALGSALGTAVAGPIGGAIGGVIGQLGGKQVAEFGTSGKDTAEVAAVALLATPLAPAALAYLAYETTKGDGKSPQEEALANIDKWIEETLKANQENGSGTSLNLENLQTSAFSDNPNWADDMWASFDERAVTSFSGLGEALTQLGGVGEDVGGQLGYILANNLNGNLDQARMLLIEMGIGAQDLEAAFLQIGLTGEETWHTVETYMQSIGDLTGEGLVGIGDLEGAMLQFINSGGRGQEALIAIRNIGIEGMEAGAESMDALRAHLIGLNKFTTEQISALMSAFGQRGIDSLGAIADASDRALGGVTADAESLGFAWSDSIGQGLEDSIGDVQKLKDVLDKLPDTIEKNIVLKVKTEYSGDDAKSLYNDLKNNVGVSRA